MLRKTSFVLILAGATFFSCSKDPISDLSTEETLVYITNKDNQADYKQYKTFSVVDSVLVIEDNRVTPSLDNLDRSLLEGIIDNMEKMGYQYVSPDKNPDVGITASWITNNYLNVVSQPISSYWGGYYGGYGYGYPSYYSYYQTSESYWLVSMLDFKNPDTANKTFRVIWDAQIRGAGVGSSQYVTKMVDSIFGQSQYLKIN
ncbi:DUF4136 domain-containing protein [Dyadobacter helix]|nr:DUF4136 domain-containing protein [Dyadobacter sp. CECT 9275]